MVRASPNVPGQGRGLREAEQPWQDMGHAEGTERRRGPPPCLLLLSSSLVPGFGALGPGALLVL